MKPLYENKTTKSSSWKSTQLTTLAEDPRNPAEAETMTEGGECELTAAPSWPVPAWRPGTQRHDNQAKLAGAAVFWGQWKTIPPGDEPPRSQPGPEQRKHPGGALWRRRRKPEEASACCWLNMWQTQRESIQRPWAAHESNRLLMWNEWDCFYFTPFGICYVIIRLNFGFSGVTNNSQF